MNRTLRRFAATATTCLTALPAFADVSAEDVWQNWVAPFKALNAEITANPQRDGDKLVVDQFSARMPFPFDLGNVAMSFNGVTFQENGDGTVAILYPKDLSGILSLDIAELGQGPVQFAVKFETDGSTYVQTASGTTGDVEYVFDIEESTVRLTDAAVPEGEVFSMDVTARYSGVTGRARVTEAAVLVMSGDMSYADTSYEGVITTSAEQPGATALTQAIKQTMTGLEFDYELALPVDGVSVMNLSQGLRDGLAIRMTQQIDSAVSEETATLDGELFYELDFEYGANTAEFSFDNSGLTLVGDLNDAAFGLDMVGLPMPMAFSASHGDFAVQSPINRTEGPVDAKLSTRLQGVTVNEEAWALLDPAGQLPRDPLTYAFDATASMEALEDFLNFGAMEALIDKGDMPVLLHGLKVHEFLVEAAGARLTGDAEMSFDNDDLETYGGFPAPDGVINLSLEGGNALLDTLVAMGLVPEDQAMGARMMSGVFAVPGEGEDTLNSTIEVKGDGQILANGQRIK